MHTSMHPYTINNSKCNTFQDISDLVHDFMNFNALNYFKNSQKIKKDPGLILAQGNLLLA